MNPDSTLAVTKTCPKDGVHLSDNEGERHHRFRWKLISQPRRASHRPSLGLKPEHQPIILLIRAGFAGIDRTWCATR